MLDSTSEEPDDRLSLMKGIWLAVGVREFWEPCNE